jgi:predicted ATPase
MSEIVDPPRVESLHIENYRALRDITLKKLTPLTVLLGPNGSGKSTVFDVFAFLSECFTDGLRKAWDRRGRFRELRSRESEGPIVIELQYREHLQAPLITYHLEIKERGKGPVVSREFLRWKRGHPAAPFHFLDYRYAQGRVISGEQPEASDERIDKPLSAPDVLAVNTLGTLAENPRVIALREFITGWHLSYLSADAARGRPEAGAEERLSQTGDNLPNVVST